MTQSENRADPGAASQQRDIQQRQDQSDRRKEEEGRASVQKQGKEAVQFYTQQKVITTRWFGGHVGDVWRK